MKLFLILVTAIGFSPFFCSAQKKILKEEGVIIINVQGFITPPPPGAESMKYRYFIKGNKILRYDSVVARKPTVTTKTIPGEKKLQMRTTASATPRSFRYLMDLDKNEYTIFYKDKGKPCVSIDSLVNNRFEDFYRLYLIPSFKKHRVVLGNNQKADIIFGKKCFPAQVIYNSGDTFLIKYTREQLKMSSPLNYFVPGFPHQILSLQVIARGGNGHFYIRYEVEDMQVRPLPDELFTVPAEATVKYNVPLNNLGEFW